MLITTEQARRDTPIKTTARKQPDFPFNLSTSVGMFSPQTAYNHIWQNVGTAWAALNMRANQVAKVKWRAYKVMGEKRVELPHDHWANQLLNNPSYWQPGINIWRLMFKWMKMTGTSFTYMQRRKNKAGQDVPFAMFPLEPNLVTVLPSNDKSYRPGYRYTTAYGVYDMAFEDVLVLRHVEPTIWFQYNLYFGVPEFAAYGHLINSEQKAYASQDAFLTNISNPSLFITNPPNEAGQSPNYDPIAQQETFKEQWYEKFDQVGMGKVAFGQAGQEVKVIDVGGHEVNYLQTSESLRKSITTDQGTPLTMLDGTYGAKSTAEVIVDYFKEMHIEPEVQLIAQTLTQFASIFEDNLEIGYDKITHRRYDDSKVIIDALKDVPGALNGNIAGHIMLGDEYEDTPEGAIFFAPRGTATIDQVVEGNAVQVTAPAVETPTEKKPNLKAEAEENA